VSGRRTGRRRAPGLLSKPRRRGAAGSAATLCVTLLMGACASGGSYPDTPLPTPTRSAPPTSAAGPAAGATPAPCTNATASYAPLPALPKAADLPPGRLREIRDRGQLIVGVSADSLLLGARNPLTGRIEGFDIDMSREVARAIFGDPEKVQLTVIQATDRIPVLENRSVDMVARNMTMTCDRWARVAFSSEYYHSGQKLLVAKGSPVTALSQLAGKKVCAPNGTSSMDKLRTFTGVTAVGADTHTGCLVLFQQGKVDAITGDDTVLAGLVAQDPYAYVPPGDPITSEPYGLAVNKDDRVFVQYLNTVLEQMRADGRWKAIYDRWFAAPLGPAPVPPAPVYGRA